MKSEFPGVIILLDSKAECWSINMSSPIVRNITSACIISTLWFSIISSDGIAEVSACNTSILSTLMCHGPSDTSILELRSPCKSEESILQICVKEFLGSKNVIFDTSINGSNFNFWVFKWCFSLNTDITIVPFESNSWPSSLSSRCFAFNGDLSVSQSINFSFGENIAFTIIWKTSVVFPFCFNIPSSEFSHFVHCDFLLSRHFLSCLIDFCNIWIAFSDWVSEFQSSGEVL